MDILDIDEVLKDDSFCLLEVDNEQDDINNILQQWRRNGCVNPEIKVDTRTFTRPKRRSAQNLDANFLAASRHSENTSQNINLKVGGLVTSQMQKSFLQDTSPPSSISSSMDASSIDRMGNSLITSSDFTNVSFFKTTDTEVLSDAQIAGYSFDDVIKDRKALESLSLSGDSAIIKDCNIAQIDEMTYLSKTNSGNSTMQNSTESMPSGANDTFTMLNQTTVVNGFTSTAVEEPTNELNKTFSDTQTNPALDDLISNTTMTLVDSTHLVQSTKINTESNLNSTFSKTMNDKHNETPVKSKNLNLDLQAANNSLNIMNRTYYKEKGRNETFDLLEEANIKFPLRENLIEGRPSIAVQSTPQRSVSQGLRSASVVSQTPPFKCIIEDDVNISPIVPVSKNEILDDDFQLVDETKPYSDKSIDQLEKYLESLSTNTFTPQEQEVECFKNEKAEINDALREKECFNNGIEMLADEKNEAKFDDMLEKLGKSVCLEESIRMRRSIDNIKKKHALLAQDKSHELNVKSNETSVEMSKSSLSSSSSSERLLSRRSRLYDDVQVMKTNSECENETISADDSKCPIAKTDRSIVPNSSYIVESKTDTLSCLEATENAEKMGEVTKNTRSKLDRNRDPERFKTIRIFKRYTDNEIIVPCIDHEIEEACKDTDNEFSVDATYNAQDVDNVMNSTKTVFNNNKSEVQPNIMYQTYKKPKSQIKPPSVNECVAANTEHSSRNLAKPRSLSRPKYISGIAKRESIFSGDALPKANSAGDIHKTYNPNINISNGANGSKMNLTKLSSNTGTMFTKTTSKNELKSPMGTKAKSFTNLTGSGGNASFGFSSASRLSIAKPSSQPSLSKVRNMDAGLILNNKEKNERSQLAFRPISNKNSQINGVEKSDKSTFKVPPPVSNLRMPNSHRTGLMRPSSGFYVQQSDRSEPDSQTGRYSSSNSLSSSSSRGSTHDTQPWQCTNGYISAKSTSNNEVLEPSNASGQKEDTPKTMSNAPRSGIPKPSGLRPPSAIRRSGLPRPSSVIRR